MIAFFLQEVQTYFLEKNFERMSKNIENSSLAHSQN